MCRNIGVLHHFTPATTDEEIAAAALQYVRKVSGTTRPSRANQAGFDEAVAEITAVTTRLLREGLVPNGPRVRGRPWRRRRARGVKREARAGGREG